MKIIQVNAQLLRSILGRFKTLITYFRNLYRGERSQEALNLLNITEDLKESALNIAATEKHWRNLINSSPDIIGSFDRSLKLTFISDSFNKESGVPVEQVTGKTVAEMDFIFEKGESIATLQEVFQDGETKDLYSTYKATKGLKHYYTKFFPQIIKGRVECVIFCTRDITSLKDQKKEILEKNIQLRKINQHLDNLIYTIAHDLNSPVNNLTSLLKLMNKSNDVDQLKSYVALTEKAVLRLSTTLTGLTDLIALDNLDQSQIKEVSLENIVEMVKADYANDLSVCDGCIELNIGDCEKITYIEPYILSIVKNLISNAVKYRSSDIQLKINISCEKDPEFTVIKVTDNGIGMDLGRHGDKLFKPFSRLTTKVEGKGIGLHLIRNMIEKNGGKIEVQSEPGKGTTFICYLKEYETELDRSFDLKFSN